QHPALPERRLMTAATETVRLPARREPVSAKIVRSVGKLPLQIFLAVVALLWLVPTIGLFLTSIQPSSEIATSGWWKLFSHPSQATFSHYSDLFHNAGLTAALKTTAYIAVGNTLLVVIVAALAGYAFAWLEFPGRDCLFIGIPKDILESARIDGASEIWIFLRLILPLGLPAIASLAIFQFLWTWNDLLVALTMARNTQPLTVAIFSNLRQFGSNIDLIAPAAFFSLAIPLAVFLAFQRYFAEGLLAGSVK